MPEDIYPEAENIMELILRAKAQRRLALARLPIEEKVKIVVQLQKLLNDIRRNSGRSPLPEWRI